MFTVTVFELYSFPVYLLLYKTSSRVCLVNSKTTKTLKITSWDNNSFTKLQNARRKFLSERSLFTIIYFNSDQYAEVKAVRGNLVRKGLWKISFNILFRRVFLVMTWCFMFFKKVFSERLCQNSCLDACTLRKIVHACIEFMGDK